MASNSAERISTTILMAQLDHPAPSPHLAAMRVLKTQQDLTEALPPYEAAFVPTMGALHAGHFALIRRARELVGTSGVVAASIFVNPTQFAPNEDFSRYPRTLEADLEGAAAAGADFVFIPDQATVYPPDSPIPTPPLPSVAVLPRLEDAHRPTHFAGVCQVVSRLFDMVQPRLAVFGEKDFQQLRVIEAMAAEQVVRWPGLAIVAHPTIREPDGLAMSSRNRYLSPADRKRALGIWQAIAEAKQERTPSDAEMTMRVILEEQGMEIDYAVVRDAQTLMPVKSFQERPTRFLVAARLGSVRLIDNQPMK